MIFILDNLDSFTYNLYQATRKLGCDAVVRRATETSLAEITRLAPHALVLSPGPGRPHDHPFMFEVLDTFAPTVPLLGVCLGMQAINEWFGGTVVRDREPTHGKQSEVFHRGAGIFAGLPSPLVAARYHSLLVEKLADDLELTAWTNDRRPMAVAHRRYPLVGVQFHPESYLTPDGEKLLRNFYETATHC